MAAAKPSPFCVPTDGVGTFWNNTVGVVLFVRAEVAFGVEVLVVKVDADEADCVVFDCWVGVIISDIFCAGVLYDVMKCGWVANLNELSTTAATRALQCHCNSYFPGL